MKKHIPFIVIILIFITGFGFLLYPLVSSVVNNIGMRSEIEQYESKANKLEQTETDRLFEEADSYNRSLTDTVILTDPFDADSYEKIGAHYHETFNVGEDGLIGYIDIPKINVFLPIYHGTSVEVLSKGAGHLDNTSFPVGGTNTHSVISAHSAYPSQTLFDYLPDMEVGDEFYIHVLNQTLKYEVDQIKTVLPDQINDLYVMKGEDLVTLMTCTPYTINTHRLLVRGKRVPFDSQNQSKASVVSVDEGGVYMMGYKLSYLTLGIAIAVFVTAVAAAVVLIVIRHRRKRRLAAEKDGD